MTHNGEAAWTKFVHCILRRVPVGIVEEFSDVDGGNMTVHAAGDAAEFAGEFPAAETDFGPASCPQEKSETTAAIASQTPHFPSRK